VIQITKKLSDPVEYVVWQIKSRHLVHQRLVSNCVKRLREVKREDVYKFIRRQHRTNSVKESDDHGSYRARRPERKLVFEVQTCRGVA